MPHKRLDKLGHIGYVFIIVGIVLLAKQSVWGWLARFIGEGVWLYIGVEMKMTSVWLWGGIFMLLDIYGFYSWYGG